MYIERRMLGGTTMSLMTVKDLEAESKIARGTWREWIKTGKIAAI